MKLIALFLIFLLLFITSCASTEETQREESITEKVADVFEESQCGNNDCESDEDSSTCCLDCGCPSEYACERNACEKLSECGNGIQENGETSNNCCIDAGCSIGYSCENNICVELKPELNLVFEDSRYPGPWESVTILLSRNDEIEIGQLTLTNNGNDDAKNVKVSISSQKEYFQTKTLNFGTISQGDATSKSFTLSFDNSILEIAEQNEINMEFTVTYENSINEDYSIESSESFLVWGRNSETGGDNLAYAAWVTPHQNLIREFATRVTSGLATYSEFSSSTKPLQDLAAKWLFEAMRAYGVDYVNDVATTGDYIQFPIETLNRKAGDCEDNAVLYASLLESVGIEAVIITRPNHVFVGYINYNGELIPVETTADSFENAVVLGENQIEEYNETVISLSEARQKYDEVLFIDEPDLAMPNIVKDVSSCNIGWSWSQLLVAKAEVKLYNAGDAPGAACVAIWTTENDKIKDSEIQCWTLNPEESIETTVESNLNIFEGNSCYAY